MMSFWYLVLIASGYMYYTYTKWRPAKLYSTLFKAGTSPGQLLLRNRDLSLRRQKAELRRILDENPEFAANNFSPGDDGLAAVASASAADRYNQQLHISNVDSNVGNMSTPKKSNTPGSDGVTNITRNASIAHGNKHHRVTNESRVADDTLNEDDLEEVDVEDDEFRYPVTDTVDMTTVHFVNATMRPPLPPVVDGYERVDSEEVWGTAPFNIL